MASTGQIVVGVVGLKGITFVERLLEKGISIDSIITYEQSDDKSQSIDQLTALAQRRSIPLTQTRHPTPRANDLTFLVGWQHLLTQITPTTVVFHDSLLPRYRGFAPTVTALLKGDREIGVTALQPCETVDEGPIFGQRAIPIAYPIKIEQALKIQAELMSDLAVELIGRWRRNCLSANPQNEKLASYSIWRDDADYDIDWALDAASIERLVNAVGYPYAGARTTVDGLQTIRVLDVTVLPDMHFEIRQPGKIWKLDKGCAVVVCGNGMIRIDRCRREDQSEFTFTRLRSRLGRPRTAGLTENR